MNSIDYRESEPYRREDRVGGRDGPGGRGDGRGKPSVSASLLLVVFFVLAVCVGVAHHSFYTWLDGKVANNQAWILRAGTAIAYLAKLLFVASIGIAVSQQLWRSLRSHSLSLGAIDGLFDLKNNPDRVFNMEILSAAKLVVLLVVFAWSLPLLPIIAPGSISVKATANIQSSTEIPIQTLNFSRSHETSLLGSQNFTVSFVDVPGTGALFDRYTGPSSRANGLVYSTVYGGSVLSTDSPCGPNCSFTQTFTGPAYRCQDIDYTQNDDPGNPFCHGSPDVTSDGSCADFASGTNSAFDVTWYKAVNSTGDTCTGCTGEPWMDGKVWVEYQYLLPQYRVQTGTPPANATPIPDSAFEKHQFMCQSYDATYTLERTYVNFQQTVKGNLTFLNPINYSSDAFGNNGNLISPSYAGFAIHQLLYSILAGTISVNGRFQPIDSTGLSGTKLVEPIPFPISNESTNNPSSNGIQKPIRELRAAVEQLHFNITVGMLTIPNLIYLQDATAQASTTSFDNRWAYNWVSLVGVYAAFAVANLLAVVVGIAAVLNNDGVEVKRSGFLRTVMTTRNPTLDVLVGRRGRGDDDMQKELEKTRVRFGELAGEGGVGFGVEGEVVDLRRRRG